MRDGRTSTGSADNDNGTLREAPPTSVYSPSKIKKRKHGVENCILECGRSGRRADRDILRTDFDDCAMVCASVAGKLQETGWSEHGSARAIHEKITDKWIPLPSGSNQFEMEREGESCCRREQMDCSRVGRTTDSHFNTSMEVQDVIHTRQRKQQMLCEKLITNLYGMTNHIHVGDQAPRPRRKQTTVDILRGRALHTTIGKLDLMVTNTWMDCDRKELYTRTSWDDTSDERAHIDFITTSRKLRVEQVRLLECR